MVPVMGVNGEEAGTPVPMQKKNVGLAGLRGWRSTVANKVAPSVAKHSPFGEDQVRAAVGAIFLLLSLVYVVGVVKDLVSDRA